jgi:hypothetical protein
MLDENMIVNNPPEVLRVAARTKLVDVMHTRTQLVHYYTTSGTSNSFLYL